MIKTVINAALLSVFCVPAITAEPAEKAAAQLRNLSVSAPVAEVAALAPVMADSKAPVQYWAAAAKAAYEAALDEGGLTTYPDPNGIPPGVRRQLEQELQSLPQGPGNTSEIFEMAVNGRTAFVVQSYIHGDNLRAYIFNAAGVLVAKGNGSVDVPFSWLPVP